MLSSTPLFTMFNCCKSNAKVINPTSQGKTSQEEETEPCVSIEEKAYHSYQEVIKRRASSDENCPSQKTDNLSQPEQTSTKKSREVTFYLSLDPMIQKIKKN